MPTPFSGISGEASLSPPLVLVTPVMFTTTALEKFRDGAPDPVEIGRP